MTDRYKVDQRAALFGGRSRVPANSIGRGGDRSELDAHAQREALEQQNDARLAELEARVSQLNDITRGIRKEAKDSLTLLDNLGLHFDKAGSLMRTTAAQLQTMTGQKGGRTGLMIGFFVVLFLALYFLSSFRSHSGSDSPVATATAGVKGALQQNSTGEG
mmetsp:Transcript_17756/g.44970  ORF Transcript_17756/g.44970 Transcript_17756/m.44970 type:complete len:161 (+) Transcript_17756:191-673(+)|eukprot:CAMPEP_0115259096 /NCGR_PEP_ID=MMETSP0270-20121206/47645_1 /TAXON_ID=71861 /ORGANISM="Scrippsiella trochoidea, Strain CCMP3099" /LENGTH=160 /DNA_ID=CAMNT_0002674889 /DNA_START=186 /DNA_END=668 /DNA_ORIENTATION=+